MNKKVYALIIVLACLLVAGAGYFVVTHNNITIVDVTYKVPEGYKVNETETLYNLSNGADSICLVKKTYAKDINDVIKQYKKIKSDKDIKISFSNFTVGDVQVYESHSNKENIAHYWFSNDGVVYELLVDNKTANSDNLVKEMISNMKIKSK